MVYEEVIFMIEITSSPDTKQWSEFVYNHKHGNIFQAPEMAEVYKRTKNYEPITLAVVDDSTDEIHAMLLAVVMREMKGILGSFSTRSIIQGGPLFIEDEKGVTALKVLMEYYDKITRKTAIYTQIRNIWDTSAIYDVLNKTGYEFEEHINFLIDLNCCKEDLFGKLKRDKKRAIKKAKEKEVKVVKEDKTVLPIFYEILQETYDKAKLPLANISLFESVFDILVTNNMADFYMAKYNNTYIAGRITLNYKNVIYDWFACSSQEYLSMYPNELIVWHVLEKGIDNGYKVFDFGGAGKPDKGYGVRDFKKQFGGEMVNYGRYCKVHSPAKMKVAERGFKLYKEIFL